MIHPALATRLERALTARAALFDATHESAFRLFNGFLEGEPELAIDLYATTAVIHDYAGVPDHTSERLAGVAAMLRARLPWIDCIVAKARTAATAQARRGTILWGGPPATRVREHGVAYAVDLTMNRDASLYLDTRGLRRWALDHLAGRSVLNTFAYTGSLGVAALAGGAAHVVQLDLNRRFLDLARRSCALNDLDPGAHEFLVADFFPGVARLKRAGRLFDCVLLDPPFFSATTRGTVDLEADVTRLINKVRPLIEHDGRLVVVNNALYVSGARFMAALASLCADGFLAHEATIPVPDDFVGFPDTRTGAPPADPAPFNHPTKIAILRVRRKDAAAG